MKGFAKQLKVGARIEIQNNGKQTFYHYLKLLADHYFFVCVKELLKSMQS